MHWIQPRSCNAVAPWIDRVRARQVKLLQLAQQATAAIGNLGSSIKLIASFL
jgi:hypothetical protein